MLEAARWTVSKLNAVGFLPGIDLGKLIIITIRFYRTYNKLLQQILPFLSKNFLCLFIL